MSTDTTNFGLVKPAVNDPVDQDVWGGELNNDLDELDDLLLGCFNFIKSPQSGNFNVAAPTLGSSTTGDSHKIFLCDTTSASNTGTLPTAATAGDGFTVAFKKTDATAHTLTIDGNGTETIDAALTYVLSTQYQTVVLVCDGSNWQVLSTNANLSAYITAAAVAATYAPLASPALTGNPTAPTQAAADSSTKLATTAFVNSTALTLATGTTAVTQASSDNSTKVATTAYVKANTSGTTALAVGSMILGYKNTGGAIAANATTLAANVTPVYLQSSGVPVMSGDAITGTWKTLQTNPGGSSGVTLWIRTA